ncbi:homeobox-domain-containing protein [Hesseltinella vesiculosa]|uniref:Homeobox-domain-containing protein n=1 Tax=Hesseltinella vesiculosa TaxID=101127 RepID=A0A1X2GRY1_9FUNG|nr:homeobox-domain-containing protein [Hesseltinella vesiculosa]
MSATTCTLPSISDLFEFPRLPLMEPIKPTMMQAHSSCLPSPPPSNTTEYPPTLYHCRQSSTNTVSTPPVHQAQPMSPKASYYPPLKAKRKRASPSQLSVLNKVFNQTYFPSTEMRIELGKQLGMSPRTVQIWFQNKRQSLRSRTRRASLSSMEDARYRQQQGSATVTTDYGYHEQQRDYNNDDDDFSFRAQRRRSSFDVRPSSPISPFTHHEELPMVLPPPSAMSLVSSMRDLSLPKINLPPLRLPSSAMRPATPPSTFSSPASIDAILH